MSVPDPLEIILVGDVVDDGPERADVFDWDNPTWPEVWRIQEWLEHAGRRSQVVSSLASFAAKADTLRGGLVLPLWRGGASRSRTSLVPAICEAVGLPWIGADAFAQGVCQDKSLTKYYLRAVGIDCADDVVVWSAPIGFDTICAMRGLTLPAVAKPLYSACSIGIDEGSLCHGFDELIARAERLLHDGLGPVVCEPFVGGEEVSLCAIERAGEIVLRCGVSYRSLTDGGTFDGRLITFHDKVGGHGFAFTQLHRELPDGVWAKMESLLDIFGPMHLLRIDGRLADGCFTAIELTPDIHLGLESAFLGGFEVGGVRPWEALLAVVEAAQASPCRSGPRRSGAESRAVGSAVGGLT